MAENSAISWTDHTFNPWWGCTKVGPGCAGCYAEAFDKRVGGAHWGPGVQRRLVKDWGKPRKWQREAERTGISPWVFCASMADVFDSEVPHEWRARLWDLVRETPALRWIFVTKRIGNAAKMLPADWPDAFGHCGLMSTIVDQTEADRDIPKLLATPAAWRGLSMEPLLGPVNLTSIDPTGHQRAIGASGWSAIWVNNGLGRAWLDWIIVGGESGPGARPMHPDWARSLRDQCAQAGVPFHFKQWGEFREFDTGSPFPEEVDNGSEMADAMLWGAVRPSWITSEGGHIRRRADLPDDETPCRLIERVGKKAAGRLLDGVEHNGMPGRAA